MSAFSMGLIVCREAKTIRFLPTIFYKDKRAAARRRWHKDDLDDYRAKIRDSLPAIPAKERHPRGSGGGNPENCGRR